MMGPFLIVFLHIFIQVGLSDMRKIFYVIGLSSFRATVSVLKCSHICQPSISRIDRKHCQVWKACETAACKDSVSAEIGLKEGHVQESL